MSLCASCRNPGQCCTFPVSRYSVYEFTVLEVLADLSTLDYGSTKNWLGLPFLPLWKTPAGHWVLWCPLLDKDGRCSVYEDRPEYPCVSYTPGSSRLCAEYKEKTDAV